MRRILTVVAFCAMGALSGIEPASADYLTYPWCAQYRGDRGGRNCGFWTYQQCMATVSGVGGYCDTNAMYRGPQPGMVPPPPSALRRGPGPGYY